MEANFSVNQRYNKGDLLPFIESYNFDSLQYIKEDILTDIYISNSLICLCKG